MIMRRALAALLVASMAGLCQAEEWTSEGSGYNLAVPPVAAPNLGPPPADGPRHPCCRKLWEWVTYHGLRTHPVCSCQGARCVLQPHLYEYFLYEHPGCDHCGGSVVPVGFSAGLGNATPIREWDSQPAMEELPSPRPQLPAAGGPMR
jgi:hypothetical protein